MTLFECIRSLKEIKARLDHVLDPSISAEFDAVIGRLQVCADQGLDDGQLAKAGEDVLLFLGRLLAATTNVMYLIDRFKQ